MSEGWTVLQQAETSSARAEHARRARAAGRLGHGPMQAIVAAISRAAELLGLADQIGVVKPGYLADLLVVRGDPASSITATRSVAGHQIRPDRLHGKTPPCLRPVSECNRCCQNSGPDS